MSYDSAIATLTPYLVNGAITLILFMVSYVLTRLILAGLNWWKQKS